MDEKQPLTPEQQKLVDEQVEALMRGVVEVVPKEAFREKLRKAFEQESR